MTEPVSPHVPAFFDEHTFTVSYLVQEPSGPHAVIIDPVLDFDANAGRTSAESADQILETIHKNKLTVPWILETHAHADHLSAAPYLESALNAQIAIGVHITEVQATFRDIFNLGEDFPVNGRQFNRLLEDGETFDMGALNIKPLHTHPATHRPV